MRFGAAWYPEHWPESRWETDLLLMRQARMNVVRIAEFAWSRLEPEEGRFEFGWLDRAVELAARHGLDAVIGTPTAAPPAWLTSKYPDTLNIQADGRASTHGNRCHYNPLSRTYLDHCAKIAEALAERYGKNAHVLGWQIDNEYCHFSYDAESRAAFQAYLKEKFKTLDALNEAWSGAYWSEDYDDWVQIPLPVGGHNPGLRLEFQRFYTETYVRYQHRQIEALRRHAEARQFITHNFMGWFADFDQYAVSRELDLAAWDSYWPTGTPDPFKDAVVHDLTRGLKRRNFWLMETQPSSVNWAEINSMLEPGRLRLRNLQAVAHGADAILYWQWRNAAGGQEQLHGSVVGADGEPRPAFEEIKRLGRELELAGGILGEEPPRNAVAVLHSYEARWALAFQPHHKDFDFGRVFEGHTRPLFGLGLGFDVLDSLAALDGYKLVVAPALWLLDERCAANLRAFAEAGGHVVVGARTGAKDSLNRLYPSLPPGPLADLCGVAVEDCYPLLDKGLSVVSKKAAFKGRAKVWAERLRINAKDAEVWCAFGKENGWLAGRPAVVSRPVGRGRVTTLAAWFEDALSANILKEAVRLAGIKPRATLPDGVEIAERPGKKGPCLFVLNHTDRAATLTLPRGKDVFSGKQRGGKSVISAREVWLLELEGGK